MIHILLIILKIIGILLLVILGILLLLMLTVLFVPVRYKVEGSWHGQPDLMVNVSWFLHILSVRVRYTRDGDGLKAVFRVFGFRLFKNRTKNVAEEIKEDAGEILGEAGHVLSDELDEDEARFRKRAEEQSSGRGSEKQGSGQGTEDRSSGQGAENQGSGQGTEDQGSGQGTEDRDAGQISGGGYEELSSGSRKPDQEPDRIPDQELERPGKFALLIRKIKALGRVKEKIHSFWEKLRFSFSSFCGKLKGILAFARDKKEWLEDEKNQASLKLMFRQVKRLIAHLWPVKGKGTVTFGFDDPYTTGQVLSAVSLIYPFYHRQLEIHPVFDARILDGEGSFRGRMRLAVMVWLAIRVLLDTHTRRMIFGFINR